MQRAFLSFRQQAPSTLPEETLEDLLGEGREPDATQGFQERER